MQHKEMHESLNEKTTIKTFDKKRLKLYKTLPPNMSTVMDTNGLC